MYMERRYIGPKEIAEYLGFSIDTIYDWIYRKKIPYYKMGRLVRFDLREIEKWTQDKRVEEMN